MTTDAGVQTTNESVARQPDGGRRVSAVDGLKAEIPAAPMLTADLPGVGGRIKVEPEDFRVFERPAYEPCGTGDHLYLRVEKRDLSHERMLDLIGRALGIPRRDVATAGMKDRRAVTRQWVSVPVNAEPRLSRLDESDVRVLDVSRHTNSLKPGHLRGNDFEIVIRGVCQDAPVVAGAIIDQVNTLGCPNYFGQQRFGFEGSTLATGQGLVMGNLSQNEIPKNRRRFLVRLGLSALQSAVFNDVLAERVRDGSAASVLEGDIMSFPGSRTVFLAEDVSKEQPRLDAGETVVTGPMIGIRMKSPRGEPGELEGRKLRERDLRVGQFERWKAVAPGTRRPLTVRPEITSVEEVSDFEEPALRMKMSLPAGTYATVVLNEIMKCTLPESDAQ